MKNALSPFLCAVFILLSVKVASAQEDEFYDFLVAGEKIANKYANSFLNPGMDAAAFNLGTGWYNNAQSLNQWDIRFQVKGQAAFIPDDSKSFRLNPLEYQEIIQNAYRDFNTEPLSINVAFGDGGTAPRMVPSVLGNNDTEAFLRIIARNDDTGQEEGTNIRLASGFAQSTMNTVPSAFAQFDIGLGYGLEAKARFIPTIQIDDGEAGLWGLGLQWDASDVLDEGFPINLAAVAGYTAVYGDYDFEPTRLVSGEGQRGEIDLNALTLSGVASTKWEVINFYAGLNYLYTDTSMKILGDYTVSGDSVFYDESVTLTDPLTVTSSTSTIFGTVGFSLDVWLIHLHADYNLGTYDTITAGFGISF